MKLWSNIYLKNFNIKVPHVLIITSYHFWFEIIRLCVSSKDVHPTRIKEFFLLLFFSYIRSECKAIRSKVMVYHINFIDFSIILSFFFVWHPKSDAGEKVSYITTQINKKHYLNTNIFLLIFFYFIFCYIEKYINSKHLYS